MTEAMPFLQKYDITFLRPPTIYGGIFIYLFSIVMQDEGSILLIRPHRLQYFLNVDSSIFPEE